MPAKCLYDRVNRKMDTVKLMREINTDDDKDLITELKEFLFKNGK